MWVVYLLGLVVFGSLFFWMVTFVYTSFRGSPYVPIKNQRLKDITSYVKPGAKVADLGCGDGRVLLEAVQQGAHKAHGWELDALVYALAQKNVAAAKRTGVDTSLIKIHFGDFWNADLSDFNLIYIYQMTKYMGPFTHKLLPQLKKGTLIVSPDYQIPGMKVWKTENGLFLYKI